MKSFFDWKDFGAAFSLANLWFIISWKQLIYSTDNRYFDFARYLLLEYLAVFIDVLILTLVFLILIGLSSFFSRLWLKRAFKIIFLGCGTLAFGALSSEIIKWFSPQTLNYVNLPLPAIVLSLCLLFAMKQKFGIAAVTENLKLAGLFLLPFSLLIYLQLLWTALAADPKMFLPQSIEKDVSANRTMSSKKIVWIIFDELDYAALSTAGQNNTELPELERLMNQSFTSHNALPPNDYTSKSIPSLLTGKIVRSLEHVSANDLKLNPADETESFTLRRGSNIFKQVRELGGETGIVGFFHPYSRVFHGQTAYAFWRGRAPQCADLRSLSTCSVNIFIDSLLSVPLMARFFPDLWTANVAFKNDTQDWQMEINHFLTSKASELIANPELNLLFFHFSTPHAPYIGRTDLKGGETYFNSLEAVDETVKRLRQTLEKSGQWDETILIISSDHWWRFKESKDFNYLPEDERRKAVKDLRVPFIVKFANQNKRLDYEPPFNTVITKELILAIFKDEIKNSEELTLWIDNLRTNKPDLTNHRPEMESSWNDRWEQ